MDASRAVLEPARARRPGLRPHDRRRRAEGRARSRRTPRPRSRGSCCAATARGHGELAPPEFVRAAMVVRAAGLAVGVGGVRPVVADAFCRALDAPGAAGPPARLDRAGRPQPDGGDRPGPDRRTGDGEALAAAATSRSRSARARRTRSSTATRSPSASPAWRSSARSGAARARPRRGDVVRGPARQRRRAAPGGRSGPAARRRSSRRSTACAAAPRWGAAPAACGRRARSRIRSRSRWSPRRTAPRARRSPNATSSCRRAASSGDSPLVLLDEEDARSPTATTTSPRWRSPSTTPARARPGGHDRRRAGPEAPHSAPQGPPDQPAERPRAARGRARDPRQRRSQPCRRGAPAAHPVTLEQPTSGIAEGSRIASRWPPTAARRLHEMAGLALRLAAVELECAAQAIDLRGHTGGLGAGTARAYERGPAHRAVRGRRDAPNGDLGRAHARLAPRPETHPDAPPPRSAP